VSRRPTIEVWMPLHFRDITKACGRMTELEELAFRRLLDDQWLNGPAPDNDATLAQIVRYTPAKWRKVRPALEPHFIRSGGRWFHDATERRRIHALEVSDSKRRTNANEGANAHPNAMPDDAANADIRVLGSSSDSLVPSSIQGLSTDPQGSHCAADVIPLVGRAGR
jgi:uncharacterized protein YdaU (DUF1376 family)